MKDITSLTKMIWTKNPIFPENKRIENIQYSIKCNKTHTPHTPFSEMDYMGPFSDFARDLKVLTTSLLLALKRSIDHEFIGLEKNL